jgi:hypothetical protein
MGTVWYIARIDTKELFDIGKTGFWFADANGLSNDNPTPSISADRERIAEIVKHYEFDEAKNARLVDRLVSFIGPGAVVVDEHELTLEDFDDDLWKWRGEVYRQVGCVYDWCPAIGDRVSWAGALNFGTVPVRWVGRVVHLGFGVPYYDETEAKDLSKWVEYRGGLYQREAGRHPAVEVEPDYPQHGEEGRRWPEPIIVAVKDLTRES